MNYKELTEVLEQVYLEAISLSSLMQDQEKCRKGLEKDHFIHDQASLEAAQAETEEAEQEYRKATSSLNNSRMLLLRLNARIELSCYQSVGFKVLDMTFIARKVGGELYIYETDNPSATEYIDPHIAIVKADDDYICVIDDTSYCIS